MISSIFLGSDCSGSDKSFNRELTVPKGIGLVTVDRKTLHPEVDYTVSDTRITFLIRVNNKHKIVIFALEKYSPNAPPPLFVEVKKRYSIHASISFELKKEVKISGEVLKEITLNIDLSSGVKREVVRKHQINVRIEKEITKFNTITSKLDHSDLIEILENI